MEGQSVPEPRASYRERSVPSGLSLVLGTTSWSWLSDLRARAGNSRKPASHK
ncbi:hypothetical protein WMY93_033159 [Mugilogobius chulae]|uniref:Uncharacterized protein n=1 Tax=Mugilogobius chulae TaxID=88201 RepID=A0AAW0MUN4_9GOBI